MLSVSEVRGKPGVALRALAKALSVVRAYQCSTPDAVSRDCAHTVCFLGHVGTCVSRWNTGKNNKAIIYIYKKQFLIHFRKKLMNNIFLIKHRY